MFAWNNNSRPIGHGSGFNPADYTFEGDGLMYAFQEAFHELSECDMMLAKMNTKAVDVYSKGYHSGGPEIAQESVNSFMNSTTVTEGFLGDLKDKLINLLKKLKEKIKAFFHSAVQYFDKWFKTEAEFANKYESEIDKKESEGGLDGFKYKLYDWDLDAFKADANWEKMKTNAEKAARKEGVVFESLLFGRGDWVSALMETKLLYSRPRDGGSDEIKEFDSTDVNGILQARKDGFSPVKNQPKGEDGEQLDSDANSEKETSASKVESIKTSQRKAIQKAVMDALGYADSSSMEAFKKSIAKKLRGDKSEPREKEPNMSDIIKGLQDYKEHLTNIEEAGDTLTQAIDEEIEKLNDSKSDKKGDDAKKIKNHVDIFTEAKNVYMAAFNVYKDGLKERGTQYKNCLSAALHYKTDKKN